MYRRVIGIVVEQLGVEPKEVTLSASFGDDLGVNSLDTVMLVNAFDDEFGIEILGETAAKTKTVGDAVRLIKSLTCKQ
ncbi:MAG: acyl carrier protein [Candidatus Korobacteraceae bacterium]